MIHSFGDQVIAKILSIELRFLHALVLTNVFRRGTIFELALTLDPLSFGFYSSTLRLVLPNLPDQVKPILDLPKYEPWRLLDMLETGSGGPKALTSKIYFVPAGVAIFFDEKEGFLEDIVTVGNENIILFNDSFFDVIL